jgi:hypothetical protein
MSTSTQTGLKSISKNKSKNSSKPLLAQIVGDSFVTYKGVGMENEIVASFW